MLETASDTLPALPLLGPHYPKHTRIQNRSECDLEGKRPRQFPSAEMTAARGRWLRRLGPVQGGCRPLRALGTLRTGLPPIS
eukprot:12143732-Alexandrium_andersonii.AAC.1